MKTQSTYAVTNHLTTLPKNFLQSISVASKQLYGLLPPGGIYQLVYHWYISKENALSLEFKNMNRNEILKHWSELRSPFVMSCQNGHFAAMLGNIFACEYK